MRCTRLVASPMEPDSQKEWLVQRFGPVCSKIAKMINSNLCVHGIVKLFNGQIEATVTQRSAIRFVATHRPRVNVVMGLRIP